MDRKPQAGEFYRHFKGNLYQVLGVAKHSENGEELVIYQALYGTYQLYARPLSSFVEELDPVRYPDARQKKRFQKIIFSADGQMMPAKEEWAGAHGGSEEDGDTLWEGEEQGDTSCLYAFLEAETWEEKAELLLEQKEAFTADLLEACAESIDITLTVSDSLEKQFYQLLSVVQAKARYEKPRR